MGSERARFKTHGALPVDCSCSFPPRDRGRLRRRCRLRRWPSHSAAHIPEVLHPAGTPGVGRSDTRRIKRRCGTGCLLRLSRSRSPGSFSSFSLSPPVRGTADTTERRPLPTTSRPAGAVDTVRCIARPGPRALGAPRSVGDLRRLREPQTSLRDRPESHRPRPVGTGQGGTVSKTRKSRPSRPVSLQAAHAR